MKKSLLSFFSLLGVGCSSPFSDPVPCPKAVIVAEFSKTVARVDNTPIRAELDSLIPHCSQKENHVTIDFRLRITGFRPLVNFKSPLKFNTSYFVAVIDDEGKIFSRTDHDLSLKFEEHQTTKIVFENLKEKFPCDRNLSLYVGFNLDDAQLAYFEKERHKKK